MPAPYGTFTRVKMKNNQPVDSELDHFILCLVTDAVRASVLPILSSKTHVDYFENYPNSQDLFANYDKECVITIKHDTITQNQYPDPSYNKSKVSKFWQRPYTLRVTLSEGAANNELMKSIKSELIDLLCFNQFTYPATPTQLTHKNQTDKNILLEEVTLFKGDNLQRPNYLTTNLTILFKIYK